MKAYKGLWRALCWTGVIILFNAAVTTCFSYEPKVENEPEQADTAGAEARVDSVPMPIFKQDSLATAARDTAALVPTELTFSDSVLADTLYAKKQKEKQPIYKRWWFIAIVVGVVTATVIAIASGGEGEAKDDLPEFPDPPNQ
jgi:hypothetical protein